jgi:hypothetical protein
VNESRDDVRDRVAPFGDRLPRPLEKTSP